MHSNIKLICLDLDGTTLKDISNISEGNIEYINKAYNSGIKIALVTGRLFIHCLYFSKVLGIPIYAVGN
ncbi:Putative hydrolase of the HAD superfamily, partial [Candidatus Arthromitus sp. SFB-4]